MSDPNYAHQFDPNRNGLCIATVGGKKRGYWMCHLPEEAPVHKRWLDRQDNTEECPYCNGTGRKILKDQI